MSAAPQRLALSALILGALCIGFAPIFVRLVDVGYTAAAFWRVALAAPLLGALWFPRRTRTRGGARLPALLLAGAFFAADLAVWHQSIRYTSVANATLLANLAPVFVTFAAFALYGERVSRRFLIGLALALAGAAVLMADSFTISRVSVFGDGLGVLTALFYAGYLLSVSRLRRQASAIEVMWWSTLATAVLLLPLVLALGEPLWPQSARGWAVLLGLALLSHVGGQTLIAYAMAHLPAAFSAVSLLVQPLAAALFAWLLLAEPFGPRQAAGGAVVLAGILLCRLALGPASPPRVASSRAAPRPR